MKMNRVRKASSSKLVTLMQDGEVTEAGMGQGVPLRDTRRDPMLASQLVQGHMVVVTWDGQGTRCAGGFVESIQLPVMSKRLVVGAKLKGKSKVKGKQYEEFEVPGVLKLKLFPPHQFPEYADLRVSGEAFYGGRDAQYTLYAATESEATTISRLQSRATEAEMAQYAKQAVRPKRELPDALKQHAMQRNALRASSTIALLSQEHG